MYDIIIIGAGPAGLTAGIYSARAGKKTLILEGENIGGQIASSPLVENYPSQEKIEGSLLAEKMFEQAQEFGCDFEFETAIKIEEGKVKKVITDYNEYECKSIIIATGAKPKHLPFLNEEKYLGKGVGYCVMCDADFYKNKITAVVGGGNTAVQSALYLSNLCPQVYLFQIMPELTCEDALKKRILNKSNIKISFNTKVEKLVGENKLESAIINTNGTKEEIKIDGLFICIGQEPNNEPFINLLRTDRMGYFIGNEFCETLSEGIFVAGDCKSKLVRQLTTATSDGTIASIGACNYIDNNEN